MRKKNVLSYVRGKLTDRGYKLCLASDLLLVLLYSTVKTLC